MISQTAKAIVLALGTALPGTTAKASNLSALTPAERAYFRAEVRAYLLENPDVLMEAFTVLEQRQTQQATRKDKQLLSVNASALYEDPNAWIGGNPEGDMTIVEFIDYRCGYCRKAHSEVEQLVQSNKNIRLIVKEFPILGQDSLRSSQFAIAAKLVHGNDAYKLAHDALINLKQGTSDTTLNRLASSLGFNGDEVLAKMNSIEVRAIIDDNRLLGQRLSITGTPTFVMGDQLVRGYLPLEGMRDIIEQEGQ
jgi:protein-disulfide isomerase